MVSLLIAWVGCRIDIKNHTMGEVAFLKAESERFDKFYATLHPVSHFVGVGLMIGVACLGAYEILAFGVYAVARKRQESRDA
jgi:hypothetical protein